MLSLLRPMTVRLTSQPARTIFEKTSISVNEASVLAQIDKANKLYTTKFVNNENQGQGVLLYRNEVAPLKIKGEKVV